ncbi:MAG TPA: DUF2089 domain-containing protein [Anaerolineae bacterium]|jgi:hypothetical protein
MNTLPTQCPICGGDIQVTRFYCQTCDTTIEGHFEIGHFMRLSSEQLKFVETFVRCEGKLNRMESEIGLSYPTLRLRLLEVIRALGYEPGREEPVAKVSDEERRHVLDELDHGRISAEEAMRVLQGGE